MLAVAPFVVAATQAWFWKHEHSTAPVAAGVFVVLLVALLLRQRWAWFLLCAFEGAVLISYAFAFTNIVAFALDAASFALLLSPQIRRYVLHR
jgi:hypothetical protein